MPLCRSIYFNVFISKSLHGWIRALSLWGGGIDDGFYVKLYISCIMQSGTLC